MRAAAAFVACLGVAAVMATPTVHATDPDVGKGMVEIVASKGYACEEHFVTTDDGYILGVFRIPAGRNEPPPAPGSKTAKPVAFLQHGLLDSSYTWVNNFPTQSLGFLLADAGYDVWFGNSRGNFYSRRHTHLDPDKDAAFWAFDFDEMALSDLPAMLQYAQEVSGAKTLSYVGHSQGTTQAFAAFSSDPEWATTIDLFGALAPVAYVHHQGSILLSLAADLDVDKWAALFGIREFLPDASFLQKLDPDICSLLPTGCDVVLFFICGPTNNLNASRIDVYVSETPAGTSGECRRPAASNACVARCAAAWLSESGMARVSVTNGAPSNVDDRLECSTPPLAVTQRLTDVNPGCTAAFGRLHALARVRTYTPCTQSKTWATGRKACARRPLSTTTTGAVCSTARTRSTTARRRRRATR